MPRLHRSRPDLVGSLQVLGDLLQKTGRGKEAEQVLLRALDLLEKEGDRWTMSGEKNPLALSNKTLRTYAHVLEQKGNFDAAESSYRKALEFGTQLTQKLPHDENRRRLLHQ